MKGNWMRSAVAVAVLAAASATAAAQGPGAVRKQAESTLLVKGSIVIEADGRSGGVTIDRPEALPKEIVGFVTETAREWKFKPVEQDGKVVRAKAPMTVRVVAKRAEGDKYQVAIRSANFGEDAPGTIVKSTRMSPPRYPREAVKIGVAGTVFLAVRVGRDGKVIDVIAEQTNLRVAGAERDMQKYRTLLEGASIAGAKGWTFAPPATGASAGNDSWTVRVPVSYALGNQVVPGKYGRWDTYIPGPRKPIPWVSREDMLAGSAGGADAVGDGSLQQLGSGPQLLTPLDAG